MTTPLFQTQNLCFNHQIHYPDLTISQGKVTFIAGESGCGKSTLLKLFNGVLSPSAGVILYRGSPVDQWNPTGLRKEVSLVSQDSWLFPGTALQNFEELFRIRGLELPGPEFLQEICSICRVDTPLDQDTATFSGGERHRLYMALFLALKPKVLMLDEPTAALDERTTTAVIESVIGFCREQGIEVLVVSHDRSLLEQYGQYTVELTKGGDRP